MQLIRLPLWPYSQFFTCPVNVAMYNAVVMLLQREAMGGVSKPHTNIASDAAYDRAFNKRRR